MIKKILITGVNGELGQFFTKRLSSLNYEVVGIGKQEDAINPNELLDYYQVDLTSPEKIIKASNDIIEKHGSFDVLINNAGIKFFEYFEKTDITSILDVLKVNTIAPILLTRLFLSNLNKPGQVFYISSNAALHGYSTSSVYSASKIVFVPLVESLNKELSGTEIDFYTICPSNLSLPTLLNNNNFNKANLIDPERIIQIINRLITRRSDKKIYMLIPLKTRLLMAFYKLIEGIKLIIR